jgi:Protein of unknown function (DUF1360)
MDSPTAGYSSDERPLGSYALLVAVFNSLLLGFIYAVRRSRRQLPDRVAVGDVLLLGAATHKLSRLVTKNKPTSALRAPFTEYEGPAGRGEVDEKPRGQGLRRALGELLVCPYCMGLWVAAALACCLVMAPRATRFVAAIFTVLGISDVFQIAHRLAGEVSPPGPQASDGNAAQDAQSSSSPAGV